MRKLVIVGASGHGKVVADIAEKTRKYKEIVFLDDDTSIDKVGDYPVIGRTCDYHLVDKDDEVIVAIGNAAIREKIQNCFCDEGKSIATLIHTDASIANNVEIGMGTVVMAGAVINSDTVIGKGCIINTCSSVDHDNKVGNFVHIAVGSHLAGNVNVDSLAWIGAGAIIINNVSVGSTCTIGAGAVVVKNIETGGIYMGVPAKRKEEKEK